MLADMPDRGGLATWQPCFCVSPRSPARPRVRLTCSQHCARHKVSGTQWRLVGAKLLQADQATQCPYPCPSPGYRAHGHPQTTQQTLLVLNQPNFTRQQRSRTGNFHSVTDPKRHFLKKSKMKYNLLIITFPKDLNYGSWLRTRLSESN